MSVYIIPLIFISIIIIAVVKKVAIYDSFVDGAKQGLKLSLDVFPYLVAMFIAIELFRVSGLSAIVTKAIAPVLTGLGIPPELGELMVIRPFSGAGGIAMLKDIYSSYGADSYIGKCASVIVGCQETVFYIIAVYFATSNVKKLRYCLPVVLFSTVIGAIAACLLCK